MKPSLAILAGVLAFGFGLLTKATPADVQILFLLWLLLFRSLDNKPVS